MRPPIQPPRQFSSHDNYVDGSRGWRVFFVVLVIGAVLGVGFRIFLSPDRVKGWIDHAIANQPADIALKVSSAHVRLSRGAWPEFAIELRGVEVSFAPGCRTIPALTVASLRAPLRIGALFSGRIALGVLSAEDLVIDLDEVKERCHAGASAPRPAPSQQASAPSRAAAATETRAPASATKPWWRPEELAQVQKVISGFEFTRVELRFENRTKRVLLDSFSARSNEGEPNIRVQADLQLPPETTYGEKIPGFEFEGDMRADSADVVVNAELSEGSLIAKAKVAPAANGLVEVDAQLAVKQLPLSMMGPLLTKSGIVKGEFRPRFLWLDCEAKISGIFQGLLDRNPLHLSACVIQGNGAKIIVDKAVRRPNGTWEPFAVSLENVEVKRLLETFGAHSIDGVVSEQGRMSGRIDVSNADHARFKGTLRGLQARFSSQNVVAFQTIESVEAWAETQGRRLKGSIESAKLAGGEFEGRFNFEFNTDSQDGEIRADIKRLVLDQGVQKLLVGGKVDQVEGDALLNYKRGELASARGAFELRALSGSSVRFERASVVAERTAGAEDFVLTLHAPKIEIKKQSALMGAVKAIFADHPFKDEWIAIRDSDFRARVLGDGGLYWERAQGTLEDGRVRVSSSGYMGKGRERAISGEVSVDHSALKKFRWIIAGHLGAPIFVDRVSGRSQSEVSGGTANDGSRLRDLSEKVIRGARKILPNTNESVGK